MEQAGVPRVVKMVTHEGMDRMLQPSLHRLVHGGGDNSDGSKVLTENCSVIWGLVRSSIVCWAASLLCPEIL